MNHIIVSQRKPDPTEKGGNYDKRRYSARKNISFQIQKELNMYIHLHFHIFLFIFDKYISLFPPCESLVEIIPVWV